MANKFPGVRSKGGRLYVHYWVAGRKIEEQARDCRTKAEAAAYRADRLRELENGTWVLAKAKEQAAASSAGWIDGAPKFQVLLDLYKKHVQPGKKCQDYQEVTCRILEARFGEVSLRALTPALLEQWILELEGRAPDPFGKGAKKRTPSTIRKYLFFLGGVFRQTGKTAAGRQLLAGFPNPVDGIRIPDEPEPRKAAFTDAQIQAVLEVLRERQKSKRKEVAAAGRYLERWLLLCLGLGLRVHEARTLTVGQVDLKSGLVNVQGKSGPREAAIPRALWPVFRGWCEGRKLNELVVGTDLPRPPYRILREVFQQAGVPWGATIGLTLRSMRTTFSQAARRAGAGIQDLADQAGHDPETLRQNYASASLEQKRAAAEAAVHHFTSQFPAIFGPTAKMAQTADELSPEERAILLNPGNLQDA